MERVMVGIIGRGWLAMPVFLLLSGLFWDGLLCQAQFYSWGCPASAVFAEKKFFADFETNTNLENGGLGLGIAGLSPHPRRDANHSQLRSLALMPQDSQSCAPSFACLYLVFWTEYLVQLQVAIV